MLQKYFEENKFICLTAFLFPLRQNNDVNTKFFSLLFGCLFGLSTVFAYDLPSEAALIVQRSVPTYSHSSSRSHTVTVKNAAITVEPHNRIHVFVVCYNKLYTSVTAKFDGKTLSTSR